MRRITSVDDLGTLVEPDSSSRGEAIETRRDLEAALQQLSAEHRAAVWMIDVNGLTYAEASSVGSAPALVDSGVRYFELMPLCERH